MSVNGGNLLLIAPLALPRHCGLVIQNELWNTYCLHRTRAIQHLLHFNLRIQHFTRTSSMGVDQRGRVGTSLPPQNLE